MDKKRDDTTVAKVDPPSNQDSDPPTCHAAREQLSSSNNHHTNHNENDLPKQNTNSDTRLLKGKQPISATHTGLPLPTRRIGSTYLDRGYKSRLSSPIHEATRDVSPSPSQLSLLPPPYPSAPSQKVQSTSGLPLRPQSLSSQSPLFRGVSPSPSHKPPHHHAILAKDDFIFPFQKRVAPTPDRSGTTTTNMNGCQTGPSQSQSQSQGQFHHTPRHSPALPPTPQKVLKSTKDGTPTRLISPSPSALGRRLSLSQLSQKQHQQQQQQQSPHGCASRPGTPQNPCTPHTPLMRPTPRRARSFHALTPQSNRNSKGVLISESIHARRNLLDEFQFKYREKSQSSGNQYSERGSVCGSDPDRVNTNTNNHQEQHDVVANTTGDDLSLGNPHYNHNHDESSTLSVQSSSSTHRLASAQYKSRQEIASQFKTTVALSALCSNQENLLTSTLDVTQSHIVIRKQYTKDDSSLMTTPQRKRKLSTIPWLLNSPTSTTQSSLHHRNDRGTVSNELSSPATSVLIDGTTITIRRTSAEEEYHQQMASLAESVSTALFSTQASTHHAPSHPNQESRDSWDEDGHGRGGDPPSPTLHRSLTSTHTATSSQSQLEDEYAEQHHIPPSQLPPQTPLNNLFVRASQLFTTTRTTPPPQSVSTSRSPAYTQPQSQLRAGQIPNTPNAPFSMSQSINSRDATGLSLDLITPRQQQHPPPPPPPQRAFSSPTSITSASTSTRLMDSTGQNDHEVSSQPMNASSQRPAYSNTIDNTPIAFTIPENRSTLRIFQRLREETPIPITSPYQSQEQQLPHTDARDSISISSQQSLQYLKRPRILTKPSLSLVDDSPSGNLLHRPGSRGLNSYYVNVLMSSSPSPLLQPFNPLSLPKQPSFSSPLLSTPHLHPNQSSPHFIANPTREFPLSEPIIYHAPTLVDDFYISILDWSKSNTIILGGGHDINMWNMNTSAHSSFSILPGITSSHTHHNSTPKIQSVCCMEQNLLAVGSDQGLIYLFDTETTQHITTLVGHIGRVGTLSYCGAQYTNDYNMITNSYQQSLSLLASGGRDRTVNIYDHRASTQPLFRLHGHQQEVCGIRWSHDGLRLATGSNDNSMRIWSVYGETKVYQHHRAAVRALAWSPFHSTVIATGGGTACRRICLWDVQFDHNPMPSPTDSQLERESHSQLPRQALTNSIDSGNQVCCLVWSKIANELISTQGFSQNQVGVWSIPQLEQLGTMRGHHSRPLFLAMSPDGSTVATGSGDKTIRLWKLYSHREVQRFARGAPHIR